MTRRGDPTVTHVLAPLVGVTALGVRYELKVVWLSPEGIAHVYFDPGGDMFLAPDEARALAADLVRWAGHAERLGNVR